MQVQGGVCSWHFWRARHNFHVTPDSWSRSCWRCSSTSPAQVLKRRSALCFHRHSETTAATEGAPERMPYISSDCPQSITALLRMVGFLAILSWHPHETPEPEPGCQSSTASSSTTSWPLRPRRCAAAHGAGFEAWRKFQEAQETQSGHVGKRDLDLENEGCLVVCPSTDPMKGRKKGRIQISRVPGCRPAN